MKDERPRFSRIRHAVSEATSDFTIKKIDKKNGTLARLKLS